MSHHLKISYIIILLSVCIFIKARQHSFQTIDHECIEGECRMRFNKVDAFNYLRYYGYLTGFWKNINSVPDNVFASALQKFQIRCRIRETGRLDSKTIEEMRQPRCGNKDFGELRPVYNISLKRKFKQRFVTYRIVNYPRKYFGGYDGDSVYKSVGEEIKRAFQAWSKYAKIDFNCTRHGAADIEFRWIGKNNAIYKSLFGGLGGALAYTTKDIEPKAILIDGEKIWSIGFTRPPWYNLFRLAVHEIGHAIGLDHTTDKDAFMWQAMRYFDEYDYQTKLTPDDIAGVQALYGIR